MSANLIKVLKAGFEAELFDDVYIPDEDTSWTVDEAKEVLEMWDAFYEDSLEEIADSEDRKTERMQLARWLTALYVEEDVLQKEPSKVLTDEAKE